MLFVFVLSSSSMVFLRIVRVGLCCPTTHPSSRCGERARAAAATGTAAKAGTAAEAGAEAAGGRRQRRRSAVPRGGEEAETDLPRYLHQVNPELLTWKTLEPSMLVSQFFRTFAEILNPSRRRLALNPLRRLRRLECGSLLWLLRICFFARSACALVVLKD